MTFNASAEARFAMGLIGTKLTATQGMLWNPILVQRNLPSEVTSGSLSDGKIVFNVPYVFETQSWYDEEMLLTYALRNDTVIIAEGSRVIPSGEIIKGEINFEINEEISSEYLGESGSFPIDWSLGLSKDLHIIDETASLLWGAPLDSVEIISISNETLTPIRIEYRVSNDYQTNFNGTIDIQIFDNVTNLLGSRIDSLNITSGRGIRQTIPVIVNWAEVVEEPLIIKMKWIEETLGIEHELTTVYHPED